MSNEDNNIEEENINSYFNNGNENINSDVNCEENNIYNNVTNDEEKMNNSIPISSEEFIRMQKKLNKSFIKNVILSIFCLICVVIFLLEGVIIYVIYKKNEGFFNIISNTNTIDNISTTSVAKRSIDIDSFVEKLNYVEYLVNHAFYYDKDSKKVEDGMFEGYVAALDDKYAQYFPKKEYTDFLETATGEYYGIGAVCSQKFDTMEAVITEIYEGSPAEKAGLLEGDIFKTVNDVDVTQMELSEIVTLIKGEENTPVKLGMYREKEGKIVELTAYRGKVEIKSVSSKMYENDIGYMKINEFTGKALEQFKTHIDKLVDNNSKGIIIDLRNNPGGELSIVLSMVDYIMRDNDGKYTLNQKESNFDVGKTLVVYMRDKHTIIESYYCDDGHEVDIPIVILINESSASASELFTRCLMDYGKATVVGTKSYGKGVVQNMIPLNDGSAIKFTVSEYFPPSGYSINKHGIIPDYCLDEMGNEIQYDEIGNIIIEEDDDEKISTESNTNKINVNHIENKKIYDEENEWIDSEWYGQMDVDYTDKQLLQGIMILK